MASTKYNGKTTVVLYAATINTAPTIDLSGTSRTVEIDEAGQEQDVSTRDDKMENGTAYISDAPQRTINVDGLDTTPVAARTWHNIAVSDAGRIAVYPYGTAAGSPYEIGNVVNTKRNYNSPHDNAAKWQLSFRVNGAWTNGTTS